MDGQNSPPSEGVVGENAAHVYQALSQLRQDEVVRVCELSHGHDAGWVSRAGLSWPWTAYKPTWGTR